MCATRLACATESGIFGLPASIAASREPSRARAGRPANGDTGSTTRFVAPPDWLEPPFHILGEAIQSEAAAPDLVSRIMARYMEIAETDIAAIPTDIGALPVWSDGFLTAWEANRASWPARAVGKRGKSVRRALEAATEGRIDASVFRDTLPDWLQACRAAQT